MARFKVSLCGQAAGLGLALVAAAPAAAASLENRSYELDIPSQPAASALQALARTTDAHLIFSPVQLEGVRAPALIGHYTLRDAVTEFQRSGELEFRVAGADTLIVRRKSTPSVVRITQISASGQAPSEPAAQVERDPSPAALEEVVVTARKFSENLQKAPIAITAFTAADIKNQAVQRFIEIQQQTPGLSLAVSPSDQFTPFIGIRGQAQVQTAVSVDPSVAIYTDGVYSAGTFGSDSNSLLDLNRVEILKGPQGTLYGKNTTGGAVNFYTNLPTDRYEGQVSAGVGNYDQWKVNTILNLPIVADKAAIRLVAGYEQNDGYGRNRLRDESLMGTKTYHVRAALKIDPTERLDAVFRADYTRARGNGILNRPLYLAPGSPANTEIAVEMFGRTALTNLALYQPLALAEFNRQANGGSYYSYTSEIEESSRTDVGGVSATVSYNFDNLTLKSITAYRDLRSSRPIDFDGTSFEILRAVQTQNVGVFTQEVQAIGNAFDGRLKYVAGYFHYDNSSFEGSPSRSLEALVATNPNVLAATTSSVSDAGYGQATWALTSTLNLTGGLRYTRETKTVRPNDFNAVTCTLPPTALIAPGVCIANGRTTEENVSYTAGLDWSPTTDLMLYAKTSRGYKSGGFNQRPTANPLTFVQYLPENVTDYEVGFKSMWLENRMKLNADTFYSDYKNIQRNNQTPSGSGAPATFLTNAAAGTIYGVEADFSLIPFEHALLRGGLEYLHARYDKYVVQGFDQSFLNFQNTPTWAYSLEAAYTVPTHFGSVRGQLDWSWRSSTDLWPSDAPGVITVTTGGPGAGTPDSLRIQSSYGLLNGSLVFNYDRYGLEFRLFASNILNKHYKAAIDGLVNAGVGVATFVPGAPRLFGLDVTKSF